MRLPEGLRPLGLQLLAVAELHACITGASPADEDLASLLAAMPSETATQVRHWTSSKAASRSVFRSQAHQAIHCSLSLFPAGQLHTAHHMKLV
jgi:hypothetical protein